MTYAETRARLRERRPIQRVPVAQIQQPDPVQNHQTRRRSRARTLRNHLLRRTDQQQDQQSLLQHAHLDNIQEAELIGPRIEEERRAEEAEEARPASPAAPADEELFEEERRLYSNVLLEYESLRTAVDEHITNMRRIAAELTQTKPKLAKRKPEKTKKSAPKRKEKSKKSNDQTDQSVQTEQPRLSWQHKLDSLDFIDEESKEESTSEERTHLLPPDTPPPPPPDFRPSTSESTTSADSRTKNDIIHTLNRLADLRLKGGRKEPETVGLVILY
uniref:Uncharacterized protein n=1 Tax=Bursaphelenchus xylophilus TaxID=6326 RepID=A0A1I7SIK8_BURXY